MLIDDLADPTGGAKKSVANIKGAKLIDYFLETGTAQNLAIIAEPDTECGALLRSYISVWQQEH